MLIFTYFTDITHNQAVILLVYNSSTKFVTVVTAFTELCGWSVVQVVKV